MALNNVTVGDPHASSHNEERAAINQLQTALADKTMARGTTTNLNALYGGSNAGAWFFDTGTTGSPAGGSWGVVTISGTVATSTATQQIAMLPTGAVYARYVTSSSQTPWKRLDLDVGAIRFDSAQTLTVAQKDVAASNLMGSLSMARGTTTDLNTRSGQANGGSWVASAGTANAPTAVDEHIVIVASTTGTGRTTQVAIASAGPNVGATYSRSFTGTWTPWVQLTNQLTKSQTSNPNTLYGPGNAGVWFYAIGTTGAPTPGAAGVIFVGGNTTTGTTGTMQIAMTSTGATYSRYVTSTSQTAWKKLDDQYVHTTTANLDTLNSSASGGSWHYASAVGAPSGEAGIVIVGAQTISDSVSQFAMTTSGAVYSRWVSTTAQTPWKRLDIDTGAVRFDSAQALTNAQKTQARDNAGVVDAVVLRGATYTGNLDSLSTIESSGFYYVAATATSKPGNAGGTLINNQAGTNVGSQLFIDHLGVAHIRNMASGNWTAWKRVDIDTGAVRFDSAQTLTEVQKSNANENVSRGSYSGDLNLLYGPNNNGTWLALSTANRPISVNGLCVVSSSTDKSTLQTYATSVGDTWHRYISGSGVPGDWKPIPKLEDTGLRDVSSLLTHFAKVESYEYALLERVGRNVTFRAAIRVPEGSALIGKSKTDAAPIFSYPTGFRPHPQYLTHGYASTGYNSPPSFNVASAVTSVRLDLYGNVAGLGTWAAGNRLQFSVSWWTKDSWPTTLPGTPA